MDVELFERAAALANTSGDAGAYAAAVRLYAGELLPEDRYEDWAVGRRDLLEGQYLTLLVEMAAIQESHGQARSAIEALSRVVAREPIHEEAHLALMRLYAQIGQRHLAVRQYQQLRCRAQARAGPGPVAGQYAAVPRHRRRAGYRGVVELTASQARPRRSTTGRSEPSGSAVNGSKYSANRAPGRRSKRQVRARERAASRSRPCTRRPHHSSQLKTGQVGPRQ